MKMANLTIDQRKKCKRHEKKKTHPKNKRKKADEPEEEGLDNNDSERISSRPKRCSCGFVDFKQYAKPKNKQSPKTHCGIFNSYDNESLTR